MSSGSYNSVNKDDELSESYGQGQGGGGYYVRQFPTHNNYNDVSQGATSQQQQDGMTPQPSVGRFTEKEKSTSMFSRKPPTPKNYDGQAAQVAPQSYQHAMHHHSQADSSSSSSPCNAGGIVNLRAASRAEDKMNKRKK